MRVGGLFANVEETPVADTLPSPNRFGYRNHARFTVSKAGALGFVNRETRRFVRIDHCMLMRPGVNTVLEELQDRCRETTQLSIRTGHADAGLPDDYLVQPQLFNPEVNCPPPARKRYVESVNGHRFFVSSPSFFQVNIEQCAQAAAVVQEGLSLSPTDVLLDAYTGVGNFRSAPGASCCQGFGRGGIFRGRRRCPRKRCWLAQRRVRTRTYRGRAGATCPSAPMSSCWTRPALAASPVRCRSCST